MNVTLRDLDIVKAKPLEIDKAFQLLKSAAEWLDKKEINQWQYWKNPLQIYKDWIREGFTANQFYFIKLNGEVVGMFRLFWSNEASWGEMEKGDSGYIYSFTIDRNFYGRGIGALALDWMEHKCRQKGKKYLRFDSGVHLKGIHDYYKKRGFVPVGETEFIGECLRLFEKKL